VKRYILHRRQRGNQEDRGEHLKTSLDWTLGWKWAVKEGREIEAGEGEKNLTELRWEHSTAFCRWRGESFTNERGNSACEDETREEILSQDPAG